MGESETSALAWLNKLRKAAENSQQTFAQVPVVSETPFTDKDPNSPANDVVDVAELPPEKRAEVLASRFEPKQYPPHRAQQPVRA